MVYATTQVINFPLFQEQSCDFSPLASQWSDYCRQKEEHFVKSIVHITSFKFVLKQVALYN